MKTTLARCSALLLPACSAPTLPDRTSLAGKVFYLQRIALSPVATLNVELQDISQADAVAITIARQARPVQGNVPLPFQLSYNPIQIKPGHRYAVRARIELDRQLPFINTTQQAINLDTRDAQALRIKVDPAADAFHGAL